MNVEFSVIDDVACQRAASALISSFPAWLDVDYAALLGVDFQKPLLEQAEVASVERLLGLLHVLERNGSMDGLFHDDGQRRLYWRVRLTGSAFARAREAPGGPLEALLSASAIRETL
ncbi:hypothetical protein [Brevundimonas diminuta]|jgi:hypothetical protein|uniref:hypothetical protein n=1 Tax=Brevundimonas diminuta TaxID=293 RepID=UPI003D9A4E79